MRRAAANLGVWFLFFCLFGLVLPVQVAKAEVSHVYDYGDLLTEEEELQLSKDMEQCMEDLQLSLTIVTTNGLDGASIQEYADNFYDTNGLGYGDTWDGILLLVDMEIREYWTMTDGAAVDMFSDMDFDYIHKDLATYLGKGLYYDAFHSYLEDVEDVVFAYQQGNAASILEQDSRMPVDSLWGKAARNLPVFFVFSIVIAALTVRGMKRKNKMVQQDFSAEQYMDTNSLKLQVHTDTFLRSHTTTVKVSSSDAHHGNGFGHASRGGGIHRSGAGHFHGGRGGRF